MGRMRKEMKGQGRRHTGVWRLCRDKSSEKSDCDGKLRNGAATRGAYGTREESGEVQEHICRLWDWSKRRELIAGEEITRKNPWEGKGDGFIAQMQDLGFARRRRHPPLYQEERSGRIQIQEGLYIWVRRWGCLPFFPLVSTFSALGVKSQSTSLERPLFPTCLQRSKQRRESWAERRL